MISQFGKNGIYVINHYSGCSFGCRYAPCSTTVTARIRKEDIEAELTADLAILPEDEVVWIGAQVDPYQPLEKKLELTRSILQVLARHYRPFNIITKSDLVLRDVDVLKHSDTNRVYFSICSLDDDWAADYEPNAPSPTQRIQAAKHLVDEGVTVGIKIQPFIPGLSNIREIVGVFGGCDGMCFESRPLHMRPGAEHLFVEQFGDHFTQGYVLSEYEKARKEHADLKPFLWRPYKAF